MSAAPATVASVPNPGGEKGNAQEDARWKPVLALPCRLSIDISLPTFKVSDFIQLSPGSIVNTAWGIARDVPLHVNGVLIGWGELEAAGTGLAVRVTELA